jgi:fatty acid desaturase
MVFPGVYLFTWVGYLMHETWHKYVPNIPNGIMYNILSWMLLTDPQIYRVLHGFHHSQVNTWDDNEFHPYGFIKNPVLRRISNFLEIFLGVAFLSISAQIIIPRHPKYKAKYRASSSFLTLLVIAVFLGGLGYASHVVFGVSGAGTACLFAATIWLNSFALHHSQLVEHGNLIAEGTWDKRNVLTRNLRDTATPEKIFLFLTHGDSREHVLHHTIINIYSRPFPHKVPMPTGAVYIDLKDYAGILSKMFSGETDVIKG